MADAIKNTMPSVGSLQGEIATVMSVDAMRSSLSSGGGDGMFAAQFFGLMSVLPNPDKVLRDANLFDGVLEDLATDGHIFSLIQLRQSAVKDFEWEIDANGANDAFVQLVRNMFVGWDWDLFVDSCTDSELYGRQPIEIIWDTTTPTWMPVHFEAKPREWFSFNSLGDLIFHSKDSKDNVGTIVKRFNPLLTRAEYDAQGGMQWRFVCPRNKPTVTNPYGQAVLSRCWWNNFFKKEGKKFWGQIIEFFGMPTVSGEYPALWSTDTASDHTAEINQFVSSLRSMVSGRAIGGPQGSNIKVTNAVNQSNSDIYHAWLADARYEITLTLLGHESITNATPGLGGAGNGSTAIEVATWVAKTGKKKVEQTANEIVRFIAEVNGFDLAALPKLRLYQEEDVDKNLADRDKVLFDMGVRFTPEYIKRAYNLEDGDFTVQATASPAPAQSGAPGASFSAGYGLESGQQIADELIQQHIDDSSTNSDIMKGMLATVADFVDGASSQKEAMAAVQKAFPKLDATQLEDQLFDIIGSARLAGYLSEKLGK